MAKIGEKTYQELQDEAKLLGINPNQKKEDLVTAIANATTIAAVAAMMELNQKLGETVKELQERPGPATPVPMDLAEILKPAIELHEAQLADRNVYTESYLTGIANGITMTIGAIKKEDVTEQLIKPVTQVAVKGAKVLTGRQRLIKEASKYINTYGDKNELRSGLTPEEVEKADEIMKALKIEEGTYIIPTE